MKIYFKIQNNLNGIQPIQSYDTNKVKLSNVATTQNPLTMEWLLEFDVLSETENKDGDYCKEEFKGCVLHTKRGQVRTFTKIETIVNFLFKTRIRSFRVNI